jgi:uncharacterized repeat protein (TIGR01451 family)
MERVRLLFLSGVSAAAIAAGIRCADAAPAVALKLTGAIVERDAAGTAREVPLTATERATPGQTLRYTIVALNKGNEPARSLTPVGRIPAGTAYIAASPPPPSARLEFSLDGASYSERPTVIVDGPNGPERRAADPARYVAVRWSGVKLLPPGTSQSFSYTVRVK